ncbi:MAG TPA: hypothetical protein VJJ52_08020 [Candidatus Nanoarchaeia archaeon]|nr:hypothetical protein [Candidatus Nanoarchaeia archaeon]
MYIFSNILGVFVFDESFNIVDELSFIDINNYNNKDGFIQKLKHRHKNIKEPDKEEFKKILVNFKNSKFFSDFYNKNLQLTKLAVKNSVNEDVLIIQSIKSIDELDKAINLLVKRLREWYDLYNPEFSRSVENHEQFVGEILESQKDELLKKINIKTEDSLGADFEQENLEPLRNLSHQIYDLYQLRKSQLDYISKLMGEYCQNIKTICDVIIAAKLIEHAGSLKRLSEMPASTIQILGAEKALFRHMKTGARSPKHGVIVSHSLISKAPMKLHGKIARSLADKISIAAKIDYFKGQFIGDKLKKDLEEKFEDAK